MLAMPLAWHRMQALTEQRTRRSLKPCSTRTRCTRCARNANGQPARVASMCATAFAGTASSSRPTRVGLASPGGLGIRPATHRQRRACRVRIAAARTTVAASARSADSIWRAPTKVVPIAARWRCARRAIATTAAMASERDSVRWDADRRHSHGARVSDADRQPTAATLARTHQVDRHD